jgi:FixJ family two-component response regulator
MNVFLVDDDENVRTLMGQMLKMAGVRQVKTFSGGEEVLAGLRSAAIFSDGCGLT